MDLTFRTLFIAACVILLCVALSTPRALAAKRVALVIGNSAYKYTRALPNPQNDATAIAGKLREIGFSDVTLKLDLDYGGLRRALRDFANRSLGADVGMVFYAGHGMELGGNNYLIPTDAQLKRDVDVEFEAVKLSSVMRSVSGAARLGLVVLDACRNNPLATAMQLSGGATRSVTRGFSRVEPAGEVLVAYAAREGTVAHDGNASHSPYTTALLKHLGTAGLDVRRLFGKVRDEVRQVTGRLQEPATYGSLGGDAVYLLPPAPGSSVSSQQSEEMTVLKLRLEAMEQQLQKQKSKPDTKVAVGVFPKNAKPTRQFKIGETFEDCPQCPKMVVVPAGTFTMGSPKSEKGRDVPGLDSYEGPQRKITVPAPFAVGKFEVTFGEWEACIADRGCSHWPSDEGWGRSRRPVINVSWHQAKSYVAWLSQKTAKTYRLLSEAEWEYVARAGTTTPFSTGRRITTDQANFNGNHIYNGSRKGSFLQKTALVGSFAANAFGLHDVHGNVLEWVEDCWNATYVGAPTNGSALKSGDCGSRVLRGGFFGSPPADIRSAHRIRWWTDYLSSGHGFRVARTIAR